LHCYQAEVFKRSRRQSFALLHNHIGHSLSAGLTLKDITSVYSHAW